MSARPGRTAVARRPRPPVVPATPRSRPAGPMLIDATELIANPVMTGIQRVVRQLWRHWPTRRAALLCHYVPERGLVRVPASVGALLTEDRTVAETRAAIATALAEAAPEDAPDAAPILVPEVFYDFARCAYHRWLLGHDPDRTAFIAYDFIPWLHPALIGVEQSYALMPYLRLLRDARHVAHISAHTREDYATRVTRRAAEGPVLPLGADGPAIPRQTWSPARRTYLCVGSIDGRKHQDRVLAAFETVWAEGSDARLVLVGRVFDHAAALPWVARLRAKAAREARLAWEEDADDARLAALYGTARATIYASEIEGYGLPPVESLHAGVPVIAHAALPSLAGRTRAGILPLAGGDAAAIAEAVRAMERPATARRLWAEAAGLRLDTWRDFAQGVAAWAHAR